MARPRAEVKPEHRGLVDQAARARQTVRAAEVAYREAVAAAVEAGVPATALARELGLHPQSVYDLLKRRG